MKKILLLVVGTVLISSCTMSKDEEIPKDCNCNRVVEVNSLNLPDRTAFGTYTTVNDCTGVKKECDWTYEYNKPQKGSCK